jgi:hypothetical protein
VGGVGGGQGGKAGLPEGPDPGAAVAVGRGHQHGQGRPGAHGPGQAAKDHRVGGQQAAQQRAPGEVDADPVGQPVQPGREGLGGREHEHGVGQATTVAAAGGAPGRLGHGGRAGVDPDHQPVLLGGGGREHEPAIAGAEVEGDRPVAGGQVMELADVHVLHAPAGHHTQHRRIPSLVDRVEVQCRRPGPAAQPISRERRRPRVEDPGPRAVRCG